MNFELGFFQDLVQVQIPALMTAGDLPGYDELPDQIDREATLASYQLSIRKIQLPEIECRAYVQCHQAALVWLEDHLGVLMETKTARGKGAGGRKDLDTLCRRCLEQLDTLLDTLERRFPQDFDRDGQLPEPRRRHLAAELEARLPSTERRLREKGVNAYLLTLALRPVREFINNKGREQTSFRRLDWLQVLMDTLDRLPGMRDYWMDDISDELLRQLCYLNMNSQRFCNYCIGRCRSELKTAESIAEQLHKMESMLAAAERFSVKPEWVFCIARPLLKEQVIAWMRGKLKELEREIPFAAQPAGMRRCGRSIFPYR